MKIIANNLEQSIKESKRNNYIAYDIGEYYYSLGNYVEAVKWYEKASNGTPVIPLALYAMGYAYHNGQGVPVDLIKAFQYYEAAADHDIPQACYNLAYFYQNGIAVNRDIKKANRYCERASESLKRISEDLFETKEILNQTTLDYSQALKSMAEKNDDWMAISKESVLLNREISKVESEISSLKRQISELSAIIESQKKEIDSKVAQYSELTNIHSETLHVIDELNGDIRKLKNQIDELNKQYSNEIAKNSAILGKNDQLESEKSKAISLQEKYYKDVLTTQQMYYDSENKYKTLFSSCEKQKMQIQDLEKKLTKSKKQRNFFIILSMLLVVALFGFTFVRLV